MRVPAGPEDVRSEGAADIPAPSAASGDPEVGAFPHPAKAATATTANAAIPARYLMSAPPAVARVSRPARCERSPTQPPPVAAKALPL
ncbi:hypothetical protein ACIF70_16375 [Actinacidiphila glaucinigra]|uniref:hypothetical protein n=1 Tax=Actinacidiphila glaucinigra TaxID=235986 RepID=UPI0037C968C4